MTVSEMAGKESPTATVGAPCELPAQQLWRFPPEFNLFPEGWDDPSTEASPVPPSKKTLTVAY